MANKFKHLFITNLSVLCLLSFIILYIPTVVANESSTKELNFSMSALDSTIIVTSSVFVTYDDKIEFDEGESGSISYNIQPGDLTLILKLKLSALGLGLSDKKIKVPISTTVLTRQSISLTNYLTSIPSFLASIDLVVSSKLSMSKGESSSDGCSIISSMQSYNWSDWGSRTVSVEAEDDGWVETVLKYQITLGVTANVLKIWSDDLEVELIPDTTITSTTGDSDLKTDVEVNKYEALNISSFENGTPILIAIAVIGAIVVLLLIVRKIRG